MRNTHVPLPLSVMFSKQNERVKTICMAQNSSVLTLNVCEAILRFGIKRSVWPCPLTTWKSSAYQLDNCFTSVWPWSLALWPQYMSSSAQAKPPCLVWGAYVQLIHSYQSLKLYYDGQSYRRTKGMRSDGVILVLTLKHISGDQCE